MSRCSRTVSCARSRRRTNVAAGRPGRILQIDVSRMNFGRLTTSGIDVGRELRVRRRSGSLCSGCESYMDRQVRSRSTCQASRRWIASTSPTRSGRLRNGAPSRVSIGSAVRSTRPRTCATSRATTTRAKAFAMAGRFRHRPSSTCSSLWTSAKLMGGSPLLRGVEFSAGALNVFDELPALCGSRGRAGVR